MTLEDWLEEIRANQKVLRKSVALIAHPTDHMKEKREAFKRLAEIRKMCEWALKNMNLKDEVTH